MGAISTCFSVVCFWEDADELAQGRYVVVEEEATKT